MKLKEKLFNRFSLMMYILVLMMLALIFRLATLTIAQGDYYRDIADNKRIKEIYTTAPRGEIRDRYGRLLAGNVPSFTVQLLKDELNVGDRQERNKSLLELSRLLEDDGTTYSNDYPLDLNVLKYNSVEAYFTNDYSPTDKVVDIILQNNLLEEFLQMEFSKPYGDHFKVSIFKRAQDALQGKMPHIYDLDLDSPEDLRVMASYLGNDKVTTRKVVDHAVARLLAYELLESHGLKEDIIIDGYSLTYSDDHFQQKISLISDFPFITMDTSGEEDFINLFKEVSLYSFLGRSILLDEQEEEYLIPGQILIEMLVEAGHGSPVEIKIGDDRSDILYGFVDLSSLGDQDPVEYLIDFAEEKNIVGEFIKDERIRFHAQSMLISNGVNPRISVAGDIEYVHINNKNAWYEANRIDREKSLGEAFMTIRGNFSIPDEVSSYEARALLGLINQLNSQGYLAFQPINIAYGIKDETVAKIEEKLSSVPGIRVSIEPVRYYPEGTAAAHILGYIGKISQPNEIEKYIRQEGYSPGALIGKTGIEESYELELSGSSGVKKVEVDVVGNTTNVLEEVIPVPGNNVYLTIDLNLQKKAEAAMKHTLEELSTGGTYRSQWGDFPFGIHRRKGRPYINATSGSVVVLDVKTGETLAMVSYPAYDPNLFSTGISNTDWLSLVPEDADNLQHCNPDCSPTWIHFQDGNWLGCPGKRLESIA